MADGTSDRLAIHELYARYAAGIDGDDADAWGDCFTEDATFQLGVHGTFHGRGEIRGLVIATSERGKDRSFHTISTIRVLTLDVAAGKATATAKFMAGQSDGSLSWGSYVDTVERGADGEWRFSEHLVDHARASAGLGDRFKSARAATA